MPDKRGRMAREVGAVGGATTSYVEQLVASMPREMKQLDGLLPEFLKKGAKPGGDPVLSVQLQRVSLYNRDAQGKPLAGREAQVACIGYQDGLHVWELPGDEGAAQEMVCLRGIGPVWICQLLADPGPDARGQEGEAAAKVNAQRPLLAACSPDQSANVLRLYSLQTHKFAHKLAMRSKVLRVASSDAFVSVGMTDHIVVLSAATLQQVVSVDCFPAPNNQVALALKDRWLAFAGCRPVVGTAADVLHHDKAREAGLGSGLDVPEESTWHKGVSVAKDLAAGIYYLGDLGLKTLEEHQLRRQSSGSIGSAASGGGGGGGGGKKSKAAAAADGTTAGAGGAAGTAAGATAGAGSQVSGKRLPKDGKGSVVVFDLTNSVVVSHFQSHQAPLVLLEFDPSGSLLASCSADGQLINIHRILPRNPNDMKTGEATPASARSHALLYRLSRGLTRADLRHISFSADLRWLAATSSRGTTHVFPISPTGGVVNALTHPSQLPSGAPSPASEAGRGDEGWSLRQRLASFSSSLTGSTPPSSLSSLSTSLGSAGSDYRSDKPKQPVTPRRAHAQSVSHTSTSSQQDGQPRQAPLRVLLPTVQQQQQQQQQQLGAGAETVTGQALARVRQRPFPIQLLRGEASSRGGGKTKTTTSSSSAVAVSRAADASDDPEDAILPGGLRWSELASPVSCIFRGACLDLLSTFGVLEQHLLLPSVSRQDHRELELKVQPTASWPLARRESWGEFKPALAALRAMPSGNQAPAGRCTGDTQAPTEDKARAEWLSNVEIHTHMPPLTHVWTAPQFRFATLDEPEPKGAVAELFVERLPSTTVQVRGAGPTPVFGRDKDRQEQRQRQQQHPLEDIQAAMRTPVHFQDLYIPDEDAIEEHVLVFEDDMGEGDHHMALPSSHLARRSDSEDDGLGSHDGDGHDDLDEGIESSHRGGGGGDDDDDDDVDVDDDAFLVPSAADLDLDLAGSRPKQE